MKPKNLDHSTKEDETKRNQLGGTGPSVQAPSPNRELREPRANQQEEGQNQEENKKKENEKKIMGKKKGKSKNIKKKNRNGKTILKNEKKLQNMHFFRVLTLPFFNF